MIERWNRFWFAEAPASTLVLLRAAVAMLALASAILLAPDLELFYGSTTLGLGGARLVDGMLALAATALFFGAYSRLSALVVLGCLVALDAVNRVIFNSGDTLLRHLALVVALAPVGAGLSVDRLRSGGDGFAFPDAPIWPLRLVQLQVVVMYAASVANKLGGATWRDGTAASYPLRIASATRFSLLSGLASSPATAAAFTWGALAIEAAIPLLVWNRRTRPWALALGACLHLTIDVTLRAGLFSWVVLVSYLAFIPPGRLADLVRRGSTRLPRASIGPRFVATSAGR